MAGAMVLAQVLCCYDTVTARQQLSQIIIDQLHMSQAHRDDVMCAMTCCGCTSEASRGAAPGSSYRRSHPRPCTHRRPRSDQMRGVGCNSAIHIWKSAAIGSSDVVSLDTFGSPASRQTRSRPLR
jgi:hypothetical protein